MNNSINPTKVAVDIFATGALIISVNIAYHTLSERIYDVAWEVIANTPITGAAIGLVVGTLSGANLVYRLSNKSPDVENVMVGDPAFFYGFPITWGAGGALTGAVLQTVLRRALPV